MNNLKSTISQVIEENLISTEWSDAVNKEVKNLNLNTNDHPRKDLTKVPFITIDGADAKDFDDAVFCNIKDSALPLSLRRLASVSGSSSIAPSIRISE